MLQAWQGCYYEIWQGLFYDRDCCYECDRGCYEHLTPVMSITSLLRASRLCYEHDHSCATWLHEIAHARCLSFYGFPSNNYAVEAYFYVHVWPSRIKIILVYLSTADKGQQAEMFCLMVCTIGPSTLQCESNLIHIQFETIQISPD